MSGGTRRHVLELFQSCVGSPIHASNIYDSDEVSEDDATQITASQHMSKMAVEQHASTSVAKVFSKEMRVAVQGHEEPSHRPPVTKEIHKKTAREERPGTSGQYKHHGDGEHERQKVGKNMANRSTQGLNQESDHQFYGSEEFDSKRYGGTQIEPVAKSKESTSQILKRKAKRQNMEQSKRKKKKNQDPHQEYMSDGAEEQMTANDNARETQERNARFTFNENLALIEHLIPHYDRLQGHLLPSTDNYWKQLKWQEITDAVNSVGEFKRDWRTVRKRLQDIKRDVRKKITMEVKEKKKTGNCGASVYFKDYEKLLRPYLDNDSIAGIEEGDDMFETEEGTEEQSKKQPQETLMLFSDNIDNDQDMLLTQNDENQSPNDEVLSLEDMDNSQVLQSQCTQPQGEIRSTNVAVGRPQQREVQNTPRGTRATTSAKQPRSICRARNADKEQFLFDKEQSQKFHNAQQLHRESMMERLDNLTQQFKTLNENLNQFLVALQLQNNQLLIFMAEMKEVLKTFVSCFTTCPVAEGQEIVLNNVHDESN
ncbi:myb-related transcription factor, partner of profilin-like [Hyperolius riggenbachi]|uniref:myb-related transcription factor, partner of profilin-like n=1 Tax=Hyperolius riggenbachi TaxID=752182 RepID=UPI0035A375B2